MTGVQSCSRCSGQFVFVPQNTAVPDSDVQLTIQAVDLGRPAVRAPEPGAHADEPGSRDGAAVPDHRRRHARSSRAAAQGQPILFTQFIQQPAFTTSRVQTTVVVPDGGTVLLGGLKTLSEGRNEFGPPILSKIPYINRLFKNVGYGRETESLMIMVTPRIIIKEEEEIVQTGVCHEPAVDRSRAIDEDEVRQNAGCIGRDKS